MYVKLFQQTMQNISDVNNLFAQLYSSFLENKIGQDEKVPVH